MGAKPVVEIDGRLFTTLDGFAEAFGRAARVDHDWHGNLDAFHDILRGGFGTPEGGFILRWINSDLSRERLGYSETIRQLQHRLLACHPSNRDLVAGELSDAMAGIGPTVFDRLVEIMQDHGVGGDEAEDGVELELR